jgi:hypothetical protein
MARHRWPGAVLVEEVADRCRAALTPG